jgi:NosR/NirI family nitrous oxide reductase transcriptional regulator
MNMERQKKNSNRLERILAVLALGILIIAWLAGTFQAEANLAPFLKQAFPEANYFESSSGDNYSAWKDEAKSRLLGYLAVGTANGYGGKLKIAVAVSLDGKVMGLSVVDHKETASFFQRVLRSQLSESLKDKSHSDSFILGQDVDSVTGATYSSRALADSVRRAARKVATRNLKLPVIPEPSPPVVFGFPEAVLLVLFAVGIVGRSRQFKQRKAIRWISMLVGMGVLGFVYNRPLTLVFINKMLLGFWPGWRLNLYWYILLAGIVLIIAVGKKSPYCEWFCPFGSAQECLGIIGGATKRIPERTHVLLRWFQRILALSVIMLALLSRNPSISSYEVFGAFFHLIGSSFNFALLAVVLVAALFLKRPWCSYLCPLRPVTDFIRLLRNWIEEIWLKSRPKTV